MAGLLGYSTGFGPCQAIGFLDGKGRLVAGIVYHNWQPENKVIEMSAASIHRKWLTRDRLKEIYGYPFDGLGCRLVMARHGENNHRARRIWRSLGAKEYAIPELRSPTEAEIIAVLTAEQWRASKLSR